MRKLLISFFVLLFLVLGFQKTYAQDVSLTPTATPTPQFFNVQYDLPYPGILPDNPLYFLKALRDNVLAMLITDPAKKAEYDLLMADKRLGSAKALLDKSKDDLAITTLSKSGNYFDQALQQAAIAKKQGENVDPTISRLLSASLKHQQVIYQMVQKTKGQTKSSLELLQERAKDFQNTAETLNSR